MGCLLSYFFRAIGTSTETVEPPRQQFSWEREDRKTINVQDFILDKLKDQTIFRLPGSINGQQFIVQNCDNCNVYVFDHTGQIQIDDCTNCRLFIGPVRGSIFIRDSTNCVLATACQQFRTRDCRDIQVFLSCISQPIIESSHNIKFACLTLNYEQLSEQYRAAGISPWNNNWGNIHDFTKIPDMKNYSLFNEDENLFKYLPMPTDPSITHLNLTDGKETSVTPFTYGELYRDRNDERCFFLFFHHPNVNQGARELIATLKNSAIVLVQSKLYQIDESSAERLFNQNKTFNKFVNQGPVLGLEFAGNNTIEVCRQSSETLIKMKFPDLHHFVSESSTDAREQLEKFYGFASMQMFV